LIYIVVYLFLISASRALFFIFHSYYFFLINFNNNRLLMHMFINCHLLTPRWQLLTKLAQWENQSQKSVYN